MSDTRVATRPYVIGQTSTSFVVPAATYTGPGDVIGSALAWWGLRGYTAAYSGNCIDISDEFGANATPVPIVSGRPDATTITNFTSSFGQPYINKWYDQTNNGFHMLVTNARAKLIANAIGGVYSVGRFLRSHGDFYTCASGITASQPFFVSWVAIRTGSFTTAGYPFASQGTNGTGLGFRQFADTLEIAAFIGAAVSGAGTTDSAFHAVQGQFQTPDGNSSILADGNSYTGLAPSTEGLSGRMSIGSDRIAFSAQLDGDVAEVGVWAGNQTALQSAMNTNQHGTSGYNF